MIDVIIPAYNSSETLDRTLGSLLAQTNKDFNVILVDDCSTEDLKSIADKYTKLLNITYLRNHRNMKCGMSRQTGIDHSSGEYITFLDSDDVFLPYTIDVFYKNIAAHPDTNIFNSHFYATDAQNNLHLIKNGFTWCHGRLYKRSFLDEFRIRNLPGIKYCDDSFFNSICDELNPGEFRTIEFPTVMWLDNPRSITRNTEGGYLENSLSDFVYGMRKSIEFIANYKPVRKISFVLNTLDYIAQVYHKTYEHFSENEQQHLDQELALLGTLVSDVVSLEEFKARFGKT